MLKKNLTTMTLAISSIAIVASFTLAFKPIFWSELHQSTAAVFCAIFLAAFSMFSRKKVEFDATIKAAIFLLIAIAFFSFINYKSYLAYSYVGIIYIIAFLFCYIFAKNNKEEAEIILLYSLTATSLISISAQFLQSSGNWILHPSWVLPFDHELQNRSYANLGQANQIGTLYATTIIFTSYLAAKNRLSFFTSNAIIFILSFGVVLCGSKTALLSLFATFLILIIKKETHSKKIIFSAIHLTLVIAIFNNHFNNIIEGATRLNNLDNLTSNRLDVWRMMLAAIIEKPILGYGFFNTGIAGFEQSGLPFALKYTLVTQSHNIILDFLVWFGIPVGLFLSFLLLRSVVKIGTPALIGIPILIHSMLEYPLYYANFLILFGLLMGYATKPTFRPEVINKNIIKVIFLVFICISMLVALELFQLEEKKQNQHHYLAGIKNAKKQETSSVYFMDIPASYVDMIGIKDVSDLNKETIINLEKLSKIYSIPRSYYLIVLYYELQADVENTKYWSKKAVQLLNTKTERFYKSKLSYEE